MLFKPGLLLTDISQMAQNLSKSQQSEMLTRLHFVLVRFGVVLVSDRCHVRDEYPWKLPFRQRCGPLNAIRPRHQGS